MPSAAGAAASLAPGLAYLLVHPVAGPTGAMVAASLAAAVVTVARRRRGVGLGVLVPVTLAWVAIRTVIGLVTGSETVYLALGLATSVAMAVVIGATAFGRAPLANDLLPLVVRYEHVHAGHRLRIRVARQVTVAWAIAELTVTAVEAWHLLHATGTEFVLARTTVGLPAMAVVVFFIVFYVRARLDPLEFHLARRAHLASVHGGEVGVVRP